MDIYSFVNSKDIREHLRKIKYQFNSLETAWLIYQCKSMSYESNKDWTEQFENIYGSLQDCLTAYKNDAGEADDRVLYYTIRKKSLVHPEYELKIAYNGNDELDEIVWQWPRKEEYDAILTESFEGLWFDFPTPFQKGDIVWVPTPKESIIWLCDGGFVLLGLETWEPSKDVREKGDNSDMVGFGYFVADNGNVYYEVMHNYMDLEFYTGPYKANERILPAVSRFVKGEIGLDFLLRIQRRLLVDMQLDGIWLENWPSNGLLEEIGLA